MLYLEARATSSVLSTPHRRCLFDTAWKDHGLPSHPNKHFRLQDVPAPRFHCATLDRSIAIAATSGFGSAQRAPGRRGAPGAPVGLSWFRGSPESLSSTLTRPYVLDHGHHARRQGWTIASCKRCGQTDSVNSMYADPLYCFLRSRWLIWAARSSSRTWMLERGTLFLAVADGANIKSLSYRHISKEI